jgi:hypothetical protein
MRSLGLIPYLPPRVWLVAGLVVLFGVILPGCGGSGPKPQPVHGQILVDGQPVRGAAVTFHPVGSTESLRPSAQTDEQGLFSLTSFANGDGAPAGEYSVTVTLYRVDITRQQAEGDATTVNVLPPRYANPTGSQLKAVVSKGKNDLSPFELTSR